MEKLQTPPELTARPQLTTRPGPAASRGGLMLAVLLTGQFMCIIDVLVVNVAMPSIGASLHASGASLQLVVGGYTIAYAMLLITGARLGDRYGRRRVYQAGVITFTAASLACTLAPRRRRVRPAHHHRTARPADGRGHPRLGLPNPGHDTPGRDTPGRDTPGRGTPHGDAPGRGDVWHGRVAGRAVRRGPAGRPGHGARRQPPAGGDAPVTVDLTK
jgi:Major Facilitator Superfamily